VPDTCTWASRWEPIMVKESLEPSRQARRILAAILIVVAKSKGIID
jgi:hypothetical protein